MSVLAAAIVPVSAFTLPDAAIGPLLYWVFVSSIVAYSVLTAATKYLPATHVSAFICLQPVAGAAAAVGVLGERLSGWCASAKIFSCRHRW